MNEKESVEKNHLLAQSLLKTMISKTCSLDLNFHNIDQYPQTKGHELKKTVNRLIVYLKETE